MYCLLLFIHIELRNHHDARFYGARLWERPWGHGRGGTAVGTAVGLLQPSTTFHGLLMLGVPPTGAARPLRTDNSSPGGELGAAILLKGT